MRYLVINGSGYGRGDTLRGAIDSYRDAVRPGAQIECWNVGIAPNDDYWISSIGGGGFVTAKGGEFISFELDLR